MRAGSQRTILLFALFLMACAAVLFCVSFENTPLEPYRVTSTGQSEAASSAPAASALSEEKVNINTASKEEYCANITLCAGASPVMADEAEEVVEITSNADALVLNLGTIAKAKMQAMETAAAAAKNKGIAVVLDPVGVMASKLRLVFALKLLNEGLVTIVRGNYAECLALLEEKAEGRGVDSNGNVTDGLRVAKDAAEKYNCIFAVTGVTDYVSNGKQALVLTGGHELLTQITGAGCMTTTLCACCAAVTKDPLLAAALGIVIMGQAAELAAGFMETKDGPGMFKTRLFDGVYHVTTKWNVLHLDPERKQ